MSYNFTKYGKRISELEIYRYLLNFFNTNNTLDIKFKMGINDNLQWYKPFYKQSRTINEDYVYDEETYQSTTFEFVPTNISINDGGPSNVLDFTEYAFIVSATFFIPLENVYVMENTRAMVEELRDKLNPNIDITMVSQRPMSKDGIPTKEKFYVITSCGRINESDVVVTANGKQFLPITMGITTVFTDNLYHGNQFKVEMAVMKDDKTFTEYERMYPLKVDLGMHYNMQDEQWLNQDIDKSYANSSIEEYNQAEFKFQETTPIEELNLEIYPIGSIIKISNNYYKVTSSTTTPNEEQLSWELHNTPDTKSFGFSLDLAYRKKLPHETVGVLKYLYNDTMQKKYFINIYKIRIELYDLVFQGENKVWEKIDNVGFERYVVVTQGGTAIQYGVETGFTVGFVTSKLKVE